MTMQTDHCAECGMVLRYPDEFHPHAFCVMKKRGEDPWEQIGLRPVRLSRAGARRIENLMELAESVASSSKELS